VADQARAIRVRWEPFPASTRADQLPLFPAEKRVVGRGEFRGLEFVHVQARSIINRLPPSTPMPFRHTINAYRGCSHACTYCFARPTHAYLDLDPATDFDRVIVVKVNAVERLRAELAPKRWAGDPVAMGTNTDPYQPAEGKYHLTRDLVGVLADAANPFSILTKSTLVLRDRDLLADAARRTDVSLCLSVGTLDPEVWRLTEPGTPPPDKRLDAVARLNEAGVPCSVLIGPILPGLSDTPAQLDAVVRGAVDAGAVSISSVLLHLRPGVRDHYLAFLAAHRPDLVAHHERLYARGAYAPREERARVGTLVRDLTAHYRRTNRSAAPVVWERFRGP
jgi:DNA repair photolyase